MGQGQHQCAGTCCRVVHGHVANIPLNHDAGNDGRDGMGGIVFGVLAGILIVVFDEVLKNLGKKVILLLKYFGKVKLHQLVDKRAAEQRLFRALDDILGDRLKQLDLLLTAGLNRENIQIKVGDIHQRIIKHLMKQVGGTVRFPHCVIILMVKQIGDIMRFFQLGRTTAQHHQQHFILVIRHSSQCALHVVHP